MFFMILLDVIVIFFDNIILIKDIDWNILLIFNDFIYYFLKKNNYILLILLDFNILIEL